MKIKSMVITGLSMVLLVVLAFFGAFTILKNKDRRDQAESIFASGSDPESSAQTVSQDASIDDIKATIAKYEKNLDQFLSDTTKTGLYWKILAVRLQDRGLHGEALKALEKAISYLPLDPTLHYYTGVSAAFMAKSIHIFPGTVSRERQYYYDMAEEAYRRAIELDGRYLRPRYGLAVLYVFELGRPEEAIPHLQVCLGVNRNDVDTMFVLARAYFMTKEYNSSLEIYNKIIAITKDDAKKTEAQNNRQKLLGLLNG